MAMAYTDQTVYQLLLQVAARDVEATALEFDPTGDPATITRWGHRAAVQPSSDGTALEWDLYLFPGRGRWRLIGSGDGDETAMRTAVIDHLGATL